MIYKLLLQVVCGDVLTDVGEATAQELASQYGQDHVSFYPCDITNEGQTEGKQFWNLF